MRKAKIKDSAVESGFDKTDRGTLDAKVYSIDHETLDAKNDRTTHKATGAKTHSTDRETLDIKTHSKNHDFDKTATPKVRCPFATTPLSMAYHDTRWGVPLHDDNELFKYLCLEMMQAGLSWEIVLKKQAALEKAFVGLIPEVVASFGLEDVERLMQDASIIRNRRKIEAVINNAAKFLEVANEFGSFSKFIWGFVDFTPIDKCPASVANLVSSDAISDTMSKELKRRGFKFVGSVTCYSFMEAAGMVNDHVKDCFTRAKTDYKP